MIKYNDRIIGGVDKKASDLAAEMYSSFVKGKLYKTDDVTAETCKLMENTYRATNIAFIDSKSAVLIFIKFAMSDTMLISF